VPSSEPAASPARPCCRLTVGCRCPFTSAGARYSAAPRIVYTVCRLNLQTRAITAFLAPSAAAEVPVPAKRTAGRTRPGSPTATAVAKVRRRIFGFTCTLVLLCYVCNSPAVLSLRHDLGDVAEIRQRGLHASPPSCLAHFRTPLLAWPVFSRSLSRATSR